MTPNLAGFWRRLGATFIDGLIISLLSLTLAAVSAPRFISLIISLAYYVYFIGSRGQTPGKIALKIKVIRIDGQPMTYKTAVVREVFGKFLSGLALGLGYLWMLWDKNRQTWHDHLAKTQVIKT